MVDKKPKPQTREAGKSRFQLPERSPRPEEPSPVADLIAEATHPTPPTPVTPLTAPPAHAAPMRDFTKVANSIVRDALSAGQFKGKSKQLYDFLYLKTRGAIVPVRSTRIKKDEIMRGSHIGSERTMYKNLRHLTATGLVQVRSIAGEQEGSEYAVFLPEEVAPLTPLTPLTDTSHTSHKVVSPLTAESGVSGVTQLALESAVYGQSQTLIPDLSNDDDDAYAGMVEKLRQTTRELTGKASSSSERTKWDEVAEVLIVELKIAATRTNITSVPAFLAEHLRRRLWKRERGKGELPNSETRNTEINDSSISVEQAQSCLDCGGTGFYYPQGYDGGVAKCKHEKLKQ